MLILFPCDPLSPRQAEMDFAPQWQAARDAGFETVLLDYDALTREQNLARALRFVPASSPRTKAIYRGWMLNAPDYTRLYQSLAERGIDLINSPEDYRCCHEIPGWLQFFDGLTPQTRWLPQNEISDEAIVMLLREFGDGALIIKDFVKSRKHEWHEACFIPDAADENSALRVIHRFLELQSESLVGGLVLRRFMPLEIVGEHPRSKLSLGREWRVFVYGGQPFFMLPYWGQSETESPDLTPFEEAMSKISSVFWTMDVARTQSGNWIVLELGDGQVSGLPDNTDEADFYRVLYQSMKT